MTNLLRNALSLQNLRGKSLQSSTDDENYYMQPAYSISQLKMLTEYNLVLGQLNKTL